MFPPSVHKNSFIRQGFLQDPHFWNLSDFLIWTLLIGLKWRYLGWFEKNSCGSLTPSQDWLTSSSAGRLRRMEISSAKRQRKGEKGRCGCMERAPKGRRSGMKTLPIGSARTGGRPALGRVGQKGIQKMNLVELAFRYSVKITMLSAAPVALTDRRWWIQHVQLWSHPDPGSHGTYRDADTHR